MNFTVKICRSLGGCAYKKVCEFDPLKRPRCGGRMRIISSIDKERPGGSCCRFLDSSLIPDYLPCVMKIEIPISQLERIRHP